LGGLFPGELLQATDPSRKDARSEWTCGLAPQGGVWSAVRWRHQKTLKTVWHATLRRAKVPYFRIYDLRSTYATRLSAGGVADEWVTQLLRQGDAKVFKKYSQMKLQMKREALQKLNRKANEDRPGFVTEKVN
jgi:integrase